MNMKKKKKNFRMEISKIIIKNIKIWENFKKKVFISYLILISIQTLCMHDSRSVMLARVTSAHMSHTTLATYA